MQKEIDIPTFKIRCSAIGKIMTESRGKSVKQKIAELEVDLADRKSKCALMKSGSKSEENALKAIERKIIEIAALRREVNTPNLSQTCITYLHSWVNEHVYQRRVEFTAKTTDKGNLVEEDAIIYASGHIPEMGLVSKNERKFENDYMIGTPDVRTFKYVFDTKASWSHDTFPLYETEIPESDYDWQVLGYMDLTGLTHGRVVYVLMSMPEEMILKEARWKLGPEYTLEEYEKFAAQFRYDDLPAYLRIKEFEVEFDPEKIKAIKRRVMECRDYINNIILPALEVNAKKYRDDDR